MAQKNEYSGPILPPNHAGAAQVDYGRKVPTELWRNIFSLALGPFTYDSPYPLQAFSLDEPLKSSSSQSIQKYRAQLVLICKPFSPLLDQLLFCDVVLHSTHKLEQFMARAATGSANHKLRGEWTKGLRLYSNCGLEVTLPKLISNFPNLRFLHAENLDEEDLRDDLRTNGWSSNIRHLHWTEFSLTWDDLRGLSTHFPRLTQLDLLNCAEDDGGNETQDTITFPQLRRLVISSHSAEHFDICKLVLPSLESVTMQIGAAEEVEEFLRQNGPRIKELEFTPAEDLADSTPFPLWREGILKTCVVLERLSFIADMFEVEKERAMISPLSQLRIGVEIVEPGCMLEQHAAYFSPEKFPNISHMVIIPRWDRLDHLHSFSQSLFPHAIVEIE
jgi:hypothetical protein